LAQELSDMDIDGMWIRHLVSLVSHGAADDDAIDAVDGRYARYADPKNDTPRMKFQFTGKSASEGFTIVGAASRSIEHAASFDCSASLNLNVQHPQVDATATTHSHRRRPRPQPMR
jgi:hypothetical protein